MEAKRKNHETNKDVRQQLNSILQGFGLKPGAFANLIDKAIRNSWSPEMFQSSMYQSQAFRHAFPGIFRADGSLRMSPSQYRNLSDTYKELAQRYGLNGDLDKARIGKLIGGNVSPTELNDRFTAIQRMKQFGPAFDSFKELVKAKTGKTLDQAGIYNFVMGKGPADFYDIWEAAQVGTAASQAGVDLSAAEMRSIATRVPGIQSEENIASGFQDLAKKIKTLMPLSQLASMGVSKSDLIELEFGGPGQTDISARVDQILRNYEGVTDQSTQAFDRTVEDQQRGRFNNPGSL